MGFLASLIRKLSRRITEDTPSGPVSIELVERLARALAAADTERLRWTEPERRDAGTPDGQDRASARPSLPVSADEDNSAFWNDLCGSQLARSLGVVDRSVQSLERFDEWYKRFYPYLDRYLRLEELRGRRVLEVGLGFGTVSQWIASRGADYVGLDIARGPVEMVRHRLSQSGFGGEAIQGSILSPPFDAGSFDDVIAIGSLHHTGDLEGAIGACRRLLRPGGRLTLMVYYAYSYRQALQNPAEVLEYCLAESGGYRGIMRPDSAAARGAYDRNSAGEAAPHTAFISRASLRTLCGAFGHFESSLENVDQEPPFGDMGRAQLLESGIASEVGLDLYATASL